MAIHYVKNDLDLMGGHFGKGPYVALHNLLLSAVNFVFTLILQLDTILVLLIFLSTSKKTVFHDIISLPCQCKRAYRAC